MFKSARWRSEKIKVTAVFRFRFHATQLSKLEGSGLVLSIVPAENGKPTVKLEKSMVLDGCCHWENAVVSETVKLVQDLKSGKFQERFLYFFISTGSANKSNLVGEVSVNVAEYAEATKAASLSLPFKYSDSEGILHVSIQRIQEFVEQRDEENEVAKDKVIGKSLKRYLSNSDTEECPISNFAEEMPLRKAMSQIARLTGDRRASSGSDITLSSSDSSYGLDTPREHGETNNGIHHAAIVSNYQDLQRTTQWEWSLVPALDSSIDDSTNSPKDFSPSGRSQLALDDSVVGKLKSNFVILARKAELSELELQSLRKQIAKESKRGQDLLREVANLKVERDAVKEECGKLKASQKWSEEMKVRSRLNFDGDPWALLEDIRQELNFEKDLNVNLRLQLQKTQESNSQLLLAVQDLEQMLEQNNRGDCHPSVKPSSANAAAEDLEERIPLCRSEEDEEQKALEELVKQHTDAKEVYLLEQRIMDLCSEIEIYRRDKDELEIHMEQLALDYEILKQEHHEVSYKLGRNQMHEQLKLQYESSNSHPTEAERECEVKKQENELKNQSKELSDALAFIKELETHIQSLEVELEKRTQVFDADLEAVALAKADQELKVEKLEGKLKKQSKEFSDCLATIRELESHIQELEDEIEKQGRGFESDIQAVTCAKLEEEFKVRKLENELKKQYMESSENLGVIKQLETHILDLEEELEKQARGFQADLQSITHTKLDQELKIEKLDSELKKQLKECSDHLVATKELQNRIQNLEEELDKQAQGFEADLEAVTCAKVEQEQRAIRAEEALRLTRWKNVNTAERLQGEFRRLSSQMQLTFEANEKLATKALTEASQLRLQNSHLEEMLQKAMDELQSVKDDYEAKLHALYGQIDMKQTELDKMLMESQDKSKQLEHQNKHELEARQRFSELEVLREETERLKADNLSLSQQAEQMLKFKAELEQKESMIEERELLVERMNMERQNLKGAIALVKEEADKSLEDLNVMRHLRDEKEVAVKILHAEVDSLRVQCNDLRLSLHEDELEKEKLRALVVQLKADLKNKKDGHTIVERKLKGNNGRATAADREKVSPKNNKPEPAPRGDKEMATLMEKVKLLQREIKLKEAALESSAKYFHMEEHLHSKINDLEIKLVELNQSGIAVHKIELKKVDDCVDDGAIIGSSHEDGRKEAKTLSKCESMERGTITLVNCNVEAPYETQSEATISSTKEQQIDELLKEVTKLTERNNHMETELKEMQDRYSEISLKFAEVEGERQKLVMSLRNLKNSKKGS